VNRLRSASPAGKLAADGDFTAQLEQIYHAKRQKRKFTPSPDDA
jgi:hypothetical protein